MNRHEFDIYVELYKRGEYAHIPIGRYSNGQYYYMTPKQVRALELLNDAITTQIGYGGSARSGKSVIECTAMIFDCQAYSDIAWGLGRKEFTTLKRTVLITLQNQLCFYGFESVKGIPKYDNEYNHNHELNKITFYNKSDIFLIDTFYKPSDLLNTRFGGFELTRCAVDESNETNVKVINKLFERTGWRNNDKYKLKRKLFECFNPEKNHIYTRYYSPYKNKKEPEHRKFIPALPTDNPHPAVKINGNFDYDNDPNSMIDYESISNLFENNHVQKTGSKYIICDVARLGSDKAIITVWDGWVLIEYVIFDKSKTTEIQNAINALRGKHQIPVSRCLADEDGVGGGVVDNCKIKGFVNNSKAINSQYYNLKTECGYKLAEVIDKMYFEADISDEEKERIQIELAWLKTFDRDKENKLRLLPKEKIKEGIGRSPDWLDCFIMRCRFAIKIKRPKTKLVRR
jgi:hypothetical protein